MKTPGALAVLLCVSIGCGVEKGGAEADGGRPDAAAATLDGAVQDAAAAQDAAAVDAASSDSTPIDAASLPACIRPVSFAAPIEIEGGSFPLDLAIAHLNTDDDILDIVATNTNLLMIPVVNTASVMLGMGAGSYALPVALDTEEDLEPALVHAADLTGNNLADLVTIKRAIGVHLNQDKGLFAPRVDYAAGSGGNAEHAAVGDVGSDQRADLVFSVAGQTSISTLINDGDGSFTPGEGTCAAPPTIPGSDSVKGLGLEDVNGDEVRDIVVVESHKLVVCAGDGNGTFAQPATTAMDNEFVTDLVIADMDGDGDRDLVLARATCWDCPQPVDSSITVMLNSGAGAFTAAASFPIQNRPSQHIAVADLDRDGVLDVAAAGLNGDVLEPLFGKGDGTFESGGTVSVLGSQYAIAAADLDADGWVDLVTTDQNKVHLHRNTCTSE